MTIGVIVSNDTTVKKGRKLKLWSTAASDNPPIQYKWKQKAGSKLPTSNKKKKSLKVTCSKIGLVKFTLEVKDKKGDKAADSVWIRVI